jgi:multisubunit Na+/H+ antiporter MnhB subunit
VTSVLFDAALVIGLVALAWRVVASPELFKSIVFFIAFGLLMAVAWARLAAPHVALAEAAIGAGITGALLLTAYRDLVAGRKPDGRTARLRVLSGATVIASLCGLTMAAIGYALLGLPLPEGGAGTLAMEALDSAGVGEPVTAVLLDFRAYDTLLEIAVLVLAVVGAQAMLDAPGERVADPWTADPRHEPAMVAPLISLLTPLIVVVAGYLLWRGAYGPGGAFQAGAVLAALAVLLRLTGRLRPLPRAPLAQRLALLGGLALFSGIGLATLLAGRAFLEYPEGWAYALIFTIETALTFSIALALALLFCAAPGLDVRRGPDS